MSGPSIKLSAQHGYDRWAAIYDDEDNPVVAIEHAHFESVMGNVRDLLILDAGCGTGRHACCLSQRGAVVTGVDFSEGMLAKARLKPGAESIEFIHHDLELRLPFRDAQFDRIVSGLVVDHIKDLTGYFAELCRVCDPSGFVFITVMHPALMLRGAQARFTDPDTGCLTLPESQTHTISDYVMAAIRAGVEIHNISELFVDDAFAATSERAQRYVGWPMLLSITLMHHKHPFENRRLS